jgi:hypothetical protein
LLLDISREALGGVSSTLAVCRLFRTKARMRPPT